MKVTGWDNGLCQDYDKGLGRWFANRLGARQQLRQDFKMTQVLIDRATLEQLVAALEDSIDCVRHEYETYWGHGLPTRKAQIDSMKESLDQHESAITAGRAALANAEPAIKRYVPTDIDAEVAAGTLVQTGPMEWRKP